MSAYFNPVGLVEDIMTPRSLFKTASHANAAAVLADRYQFDAIPICRDDQILGFWSRDDGAIHELTDNYVIEHDKPVDETLCRLVREGVLFVAYREQIVGLIDLSDLNKPLGRVVIAQPLLAVEQLIAAAFRAQPIPNSRLVAVLGPDKVDEATERKRCTQQENLDAPLIEFLHFGDILRIAADCAVVSATTKDIRRLNAIRNRVLHPAHRLVTARRDGDALIWAIAECGRMLRSISASQPTDDA
jgi:hypothetical protein